MKRLVIIEDQTAIREMLVEILRLDANYQLVGEAGDGQSALQLCFAIDFRLRRTALLREKWGEQVCAFVRAAPDAAPRKDELDAYLRAELAAYKAPRVWVFVDEFPMTPSGKVQKFVLRDGFLAGELRPV